MKALELHTIRIYIDALDECGEEAAVDLIDFFQQKADSLSLCFSCRHYPLIASENGLEINVEANNAHNIKTYVSHQLDEQKSIVELFRDQIIEKALGNFQWVKIVAKLVSDSRRKKYSQKSIQAKIAAIPIQLSKLYQDLLTSVDEWEKPESLQLMQWICFALRPLSLTELRFAMAVDADTTSQSISQCQESEQYTERDEEMEIRVRHLSKGLAEVISHDGKFIVQLIHQSVNEFLIEKEGLKLLYGSQDRASANSLIGRAHFRLSRSCIKYLSMRELQNRHDWEKKREKTLDGFEYFENEFPFLRYATVSWIPHAEKVEKENLPQDDLILYFQASSVMQSRISAYNYLDNRTSSCPFKDTTLVQIAARYGFLSVLSAAHNHDLEIDCSNGVLLCEAAKKGHEAVVKFLMERDDVYFRNENREMALFHAARKGQEAVVKLLLEKNVGPNSSNDNGYTPLSMAAHVGHETVVKLLLEQNVDPNSKNRYGNTPLFIAVHRGHEALVKLLLKQNVDPNSANNHGNTPLSMAAYGEHEAMVKLLLKRDDLNVNSRNNYGCTPLFIAAQCGKETSVRLLLE